LNSLHYTLKEMHENINFNLQDRKGTFSDTTEEEEQSQRAMLDQIRDDFHYLLSFEKKFEETVNFIENLKLDGQRKRGCARLAVELERQLYHHCVNEHRKCMKKTDRQRLLNTLVQIGYGQKAASLLMEEQDRLFQQQIRRHIYLHGDLNRYIHGLSRVTCGFITQASRELKELTNETDHISTFTSWLLDQVKVFASYLSRQVLLRETPFCEVAQCLRIAFGYLETLEKDGVSIGFRLADIVLSQMVDLLSHYEQKKLVELRETVDDDPWLSSNVSIYGGAEKGCKSHILVTPSLTELYTITRLFVFDLKVLGLSPSLQNRLYPFFSQSIINILEWYCSHMTHLIRHSEQLGLSRAQQASIVSNVYCVAEDLTKRIDEQFQTYLGKEIAEFQQFRKKMRRLNDAQCIFFARQRAKEAVKNSVGFHLDVYARTEINEKDAFPLTLGLCNFYQTLFEDAQPHLMKRARSRFYTQCIEGFFNFLAKQINDGNMEIKEAGARQLVLDMHFVKLEMQQMCRVSAIEEGIGRVVGSISAALGEELVVDSKWLNAGVKKLPLRRRSTIDG